MVLAVAVPPEVREAVEELLSSAAFRQGLLDALLEPPAAPPAFVEPAPLLEEQTGRPVVLTFAPGARPSAEALEAALLQETGAALVQVVGFEETPDGGSVAVVRLVAPTPAASAALEQALAPGSEALDAVAGSLGIKAEKLGVAGGDAKPPAGSEYTSVAGVRLNLAADEIPREILEQALRQAAGNAGLPEIVAVVSPNGGASGPSDVVFRLAAGPHEVAALQGELDSPAFRERLRAALEAAGVGGDSAVVTAEAIPPPHGHSTPPVVLTWNPAPGGEGPPDEAAVREALRAVLGQTNVVGVEVVGISVGNDGAVTATVRAVVADEGDVEGATAVVRSGGKTLGTHLGVEDAGPRPAALAPEGAVWSEPTALLLGLPADALDEHRLRAAVAAALAAAGATVPPAAIDLVQLVPGDDGDTTTVVLAVAGDGEDLAALETILMTPEFRQ